MTKPKQKALPYLATESDERAFWESADSSDYVDWTKAKRLVLSNLKPSTATISIRLPQSLLVAIKSAANARDVPYQSLIKSWLDERVRA
jgi:predicted DNA binding CopG/RHH family protein